jgi:hypothetical protein
VLAVTQLGDNPPSIITGAIIPQPSFAVSTLTLSLLLALSADDGTEAQLRSIVESFSARVVHRKGSILEVRRFLDIDASEQPLVSDAMTLRTSPIN